MNATADWRQEAGRMVERLGPIEPAVAAAMRRVPRHRFVPDAYRDEAYEDEPLPLHGPGATISAPHMVAFQLEFAQLRSGLRVLEIGTGYGYLAALLAELVTPGGRVVTVELDPRLAQEATRRLRELEYGDRVEVIHGDGRRGAPRDGLFDRILVSCATEKVEQNWIRQLAPDGLLIAPVGDRYEQRLIRYRARDPPGRFEEGPACRFVPLRRPRDGIYNPAN